MSRRPWRADGWLVLGPRTHFESVRPTLERAAAGARCGPWLALGTERGRFKGSALAPRRAVRHALRRALGLAEVPRLQEFENLVWLRAHGFPAVRPLLAGVRTRVGLPRYQFLITAEVPDAPDLARAWPRAAAGLRAAWVCALARDVARLHALGFVHRDLFARNLLASGGPPAKCLFLDTWRSRPGRSLRGPLHDLACFFLDAASLLDPASQERFLTTYREERAQLGQPLPPGWPERLERARARLLRREGARHPGLAPDWRFPALEHS